MGGDLVSLAVAGIGVFGTFGASAAAQWAGIRSKRVEAEIQRSHLSEQRDESAKQQEREEKHSVYSHLNESARNYRTALHDGVRALERDVDVDVERLEAVRNQYQEMYARAQMIVTDRLLTIASEVDTGLGNAYRVLHNAVLGDTNPEAISRLHRWLDDSAIAAVQLLRQALREDLGTTSAIVELDAKLEALQSARAEDLDAVDPPSTR
ncbi:hypothetical protein NOVA_14525 [Nocardia nova]|uniref:hypothetical protein n=1 Tax=Nocardia nova TaxID=37330 RepID=UPI001C46150D|nr:hypothetical protein [Nocardia nova]MBV7703991.1 hypothetical protein [Nocardia nova]